MDDYSDQNDIYKPIPTKLLEIIENRNVVLFPRCIFEKLFIIARTFECYLSCSWEHARSSLYLLVNDVSDTQLYIYYLRKLINIPVSSWTINNCTEESGTLKVFIGILSEAVNAVTELEKADLIIFDEGPSRISTGPTYQIIKCIQDLNEFDRPYITVLRNSRNFCVEHEIPFLSNHQLIYGEMKSCSMYYQVDGKNIEKMNHHFKYLKSFARILNLQTPSFFTSNLFNILKSIVTDYRDIFMNLGVSGIYYYCKQYKLQLMNLYATVFGAHDRALISLGLNCLINLGDAILEELSNYGGIDIKKKLSSDDNNKGAEVFDLNSKLVVKESNANYRSMRNVKDVSSSKFWKLLDTFSRLQSEDRCIIFTEKPITAKCLYFLIKDVLKLNEMDDEITVDFIYGKAEDECFRNSREHIYKSNVNRNIIDRFHKGEVNILLISQIFEEIYDIAREKKDGIRYSWVQFDKVDSVRDFIQIWNLFRKPNGVLYVFDRKINSYWNKDFVNDINSAFNTPKQMKELTPFIKDDNGFYRFTQMNDKCFQHNQMQNIPFLPTVKFSTGDWQRLKSYCGSLPISKFVDLNPFLLLRENEVCLRLPINCPINNVLATFDGTVLENVDSKMASLAIELLSQEMNLGIGDDRKACLKKIKSNYDDDDVEYFTGSKKNKKIVNVKNPEWLTCCRPIAGEVSYVHVIRLTPTFPVPDTTRKKVCYNLWASDYEFGFITNQKIPDICAFPAYINIGKLLVRIEANAFTITLTEDEIEKIWIFHKFIIMDIVRTVKSFLISSKLHDNNSYIFIPLQPSSSSSGSDKNQLEINWNVLNQTDVILPSVVESPDQISSKEFEASDYLGIVVIPWYRGNLPLKFYIVSDIFYDLSPESPFSEHKNYSYAEYYLEKYGITVQNFSQPLIEVASISKNIDCIRPKFQSTSKRKKLGDLDNDYDEILIPELCVRQKFPAVYWLKAIVLPTVTHRIHHLLIAEMLREKIAQEASYTISDELLSTPDSEYLPADVNLLDEVEQQQIKQTAPITATLALMEKCTMAPWTDDLPSDPEREKSLNLFQIFYYIKFVNSPYYRLDPFDNDPVSEYGSLIKPPLLDIFGNIGEEIYPSQSSILQALTTTCSNDVFNYQLSQLFGHSSLKYLISICLYSAFPDQNSKQLAYMANFCIHKSNLYNCASKLDLASYIKVKDIMANNDWFPPGFCIPHSINRQMMLSNIPPKALFAFNLSDEERMSGNLNIDSLTLIHECLISHLGSQYVERINDELDAISGLYFVNKQEINDKMVVNALKAIIGTFAKKCRLDNVGRLLQYFGILHDISITDVLNNKSIKCELDLNESEGIDLFIPKYRYIEGKIGYSFSNKNFLLQAFVHPTCYRKVITHCYQRMVFLGDAILDFLITSYICQYHSKVSFVDLSDLRTSLVNNIVYACLAVRLDFQKYLLYDSYNATVMMEPFVRHQTRIEHGIENHTLYFLEESECADMKSVQVPELLSDVFKSVAAAVYLDCGKDLNIVWKVFYNIMHDILDKFSSAIPKSPVRMLKETSLDFKFGKTVSVSKVFDDEVMVPLLVYSGRVCKVYNGYGSNRHFAKQSAAKLVLKDMNKGLPV